ncbi:MAG: TniQ family protein [Xenococcus sp. MO_188.B8]|nr:TniQ family protein [Xenococcus sp. MO_188.B8]
MKNAIIYEFWCPTNLKLPCRSRLYNLDPIGIGSFYAESLTSYAMRLAEAHSIKTHDLFVKEIACLTTNNYSQKGQRQALSKVLNRGAALNSTGMLASQLIASLQRLTTQENLHNLTLLSFNNLFSSRSLFKHYKAWCPDCFEHWREKNKELYEPLLWLFKDTQICPYHYQPLQSICPNCHQKIPWLAGNSRIGYCSNCSHWLGNFSPLSNQSNINHSEFEFLKNLWVTKTLGELIAAIPIAYSFIDKIDIPKAFNQVINITHNGNIAAFARYLGFPKNTVWMWCKGKSKPELRMILQICYCLDISLLDFITLEQKAFKSLQIKPQRLPCISKNKRCSPKTFDHEKVEYYLQNILSNPTTPPPTLQEVAENLGFHKRTISCHFPILCKAISAQYRCYRRSRTNERIKKCCQEVEQAVIDIFKSGRHPTEASVSKLISQPGYFRYQEVRDTMERTIANFTFR